MTTTAATLLAAATLFSADPAAPRAEFLFTTAPFASSHASTVVEVAPGELLSAYFAGSDEGMVDVGIWQSRGTRGPDGAWTWTPPAKAHQEPGVPCWNPVLFLAKKPDGGSELLLFFKAGRRPSEWSGLVKRSNDGGRTWSAAELLPAGVIGPVRAKPVQLADGRLVCGSSVESYRTWTSYVETTPDLGRTWSRSSPILIPGNLKGSIQPAPFVIDATPGKERMAFIARTSGTKKIVRSETNDGGKTWSNMVATNLPNPDAGVDAVRLADGRVVAVYNHSPALRTPLRLAVSSDEGKNFQPVVTLESEFGEFSYPAMIIDSAGRLQCTYTWNRKRIKHAEIDVSALKGSEKPAQ